MTMGLMRLQDAVNNATFHRQQTAAKRPLAMPAVATDIRHLFRGPDQFLLLEEWVKSFRDAKRRDWGKVRAAIQTLTNEDRAEAITFIIKQEMCPAPTQPSQ